MQNAPADQGPQCLQLVELFFDISTDSKIDLFKCYMLRSVPIFRVNTCSINMYQGPVVQSIVSLMSLLVVKMLTVLVSTISNSQ